MAINTSATSKISISASLPATYDQAGYAALTFTEIGGVESIGAFGAEDSLVTFNPLASRITLKFKGSRNIGTLALAMALDNEDAGQDLARTASDSLTPVSFKVETADASVYYFIALVMNNPVEVGSVDQVTMSSLNLELTAGTGGVGIVYVAAP